MRGKKIIWITCIGLFAIWPVFAVCYASSEQECEAAHKDLEHRREKLSQYLGALREAYRNGDLRLMALFNRQIGIVIEEMITTEEMIDCPEPERDLRTNGLSPTRTIENGFLDKSCGELKRMHLQLLIQLNSLKRREHSMFSQLSPSEQNDLDKALRDLKGVRNAWRAKCGRGKTRRGPRSRRGLQAPRSPVSR